MVELTGDSLTLEKIRRVSYERETVSIAPSNMRKVHASRKSVDQIVAAKQTIYGINTFFVNFSDVTIAEEDVAPLQLNLIRSHACGIGEPFPEVVTRAMILLRLNALLKGLPGLRPILVEIRMELINKHISPVIPQQVAVAKRMRALLHDSQLTTRQGEKRVQDAYSLRCIPQVHGASWQVLDYVKEKLEIEVNAATDNPLIFDDGETVISDRNFRGQPIAFAIG